jgi:MFS family permease
VSEAARPVQAAESARDARPWHGPRILAAGVVSYFISTGLNFSILGIFIRPAAESFGASMATMGTLPSFYHVITALIGPALGNRYARGSIRRFMLLGSCLLPLGLVAVSRSESLAIAAVCYGGATVIGSYMMGPLASNTLVTNWYGASRGRALGIIATGSTAAGVVLPTIAAVLIEAVGWRDALALLALASLLVTLPVFASWAVDRPEALGQSPEAFGDVSPASSVSISAANAAPHVEPAPASTREILRKPHFWAIAAGFGLLFSSSLISITFTVPYAEQLGLSLQGGAYVLAARSLAAVAGQVSLGWLSDRVGRRPVLLAAIAVECACWFAVVQAPNILIFTLAGIGIGFVSGSFAPLRGALVARVFGRRDFAKVSGLLSPASLPFQILSVPLAGHLYDLSGDYADAFRMFLYAFPVAALLIAMVPDRR